MHTHTYIIGLSQLLACSCSRARTQTSTRTQTDTHTYIHSYTNSYTQLHTQLHTLTYSGTIFVFLPVGVFDSRLRHIGEGSLGLRGIVPLWQRVPLLGPLRSAWLFVGRSDFTRRHIDMQTDRKTDTKAVIQTGRHTHT